VASVRGLTHNQLRRAQPLPTGGRSRIFSLAVVCRLIVAAHLLPAGIGDALGQTPLAEGLPAGSLAASKETSVAASPGSLETSNKTLETLE
jgi:hypothetical protein